jgi:hypothetical protein
MLSTEFRADRTMHLRRAGVNDAKRLRPEGLKVSTVPLTANWAEELGFEPG